MGGHREDPPRAWLLWYHGPFSSPRAGVTNLVKARAVLSHTLGTREHPTQADILLFCHLQFTLPAELKKVILG